MNFSPEHMAGQFGPDLLDDVSCRRVVLRLTRGDKPTCPACGIILSSPNVQRLIDCLPVYCSCGVQSSARTGTILEGSTISDSKLVLMLVMMFWDFSSPEIARVIGCTKQSVYNWRKRLEEVNP